MEQIFHDIQIFLNKLAYYAAMTFGKQYLDNVQLIRTFRLQLHIQTTLFGELKKFKRGICELGCIIK